MSMRPRETIRDLCEAALAAGQHRTITDLAKAAGLTQPYLSRIMAGRVNAPQLQTLQRLAAALGTTIDHVARCIQSTPRPMSDAAS